MAESYNLNLTVSGAPTVVDGAAKVDKLAGAADKAAGAYARLKAWFVSTASEAKRLAKSVVTVETATRESIARAGELSATYGELGGPVGRVGQKLYKLQEGFGKLSLALGRNKAFAVLAAAGIASLVVVAALAVAAVAALGIALAVAAVKAANASNKADLMREVLTGSTAAATQLSGVISSVADSVPLSTAEVSKLADGLYKSGKRGTELENALREASYEAAGLGKNPGPEQLAKAMADLDVIGVKMGDHVTKIFDGAKTKTATARFGAALGGFVELFGQNHSEGRALQALLGTIVNPLINGLTALVPFATQVFRGMIIMALDVAIAVVEAGNAVSEMIPDFVKDKVNELAESGWLLSAALTAGKVVFWVIVAVLAVVAAIIAIVIASVVAAAVMFGGIFVAALAAAIAGLYWLVGAAGGAWDAVMSLGSAGIEAASNLVSGLVDGIYSGVGAVVDAIKSMASSAIGALKSALQMHSPSVLFANAGVNIPLGLSEGIDAERATVQTSIEAMATPPKSLGSDITSVASGGGGSAAPSGGGGSVDLSGATFVFNGVANAESAVSAFEDALNRILTGDALAVGAG